MIEEFIHFVQELFPSINPYTAENVKRSLRQFEITGQQYKCLLHNPLEYLAQGDIIGDLPFNQFSKTGEINRFVSKGILLSNTCDAENDNTLIFAPLLPIDKIGISNLVEVKNNSTFRFMYLPDGFLTDYVIDLSLITPFPKQAIDTYINSGRFTKLGSLNRFGYYLLLSKMTIHLLRPEDKTVQSKRMIS